MSKERVEEIKPYDEQGSKREQVEQMFDSIAPAYDFMNRAMTLGIDRWWRRVAVNGLISHFKKSGISNDIVDVLDVATGTGDFAIGLFKRLKPRSVTGIDLSNGMLDVARKKVASAGLTEINFSQADCLSLPFADGSFDAVTVAFGVRNFEDIEHGYRQMYHVLRPDGMVSVVELSTPQNRIIRWFYDIYTMHIIPAIGALKSGDRSAYRYLPLSIAAVPQGEAMLDIMRRVGFTQCHVRRLTFGTCSIYTAVKKI